MQWWNKTFNELWLFKENVQNWYDQGLIGILEEKNSVWRKTNTPLMPTGTGQIISVHSIKLHIKQCNGYSINEQPQIRFGF